MNPLVSVLLPVFNDEKNIENSVYSILNQSYQNLELLVIDDGSTDKTLSILKNIKSKKLKLFVNSENYGLTKSLNKLILESEGELIARQDSDDISKLMRIEKQVNFLTNNNLDAVGSRAIIKNRNKKIPYISYYLPIRILALYKNPLIHGTLLIKKSVLKSVNNYDEDYKFAQDYKLLVDLLNSRKKIKIFEEVLYVLNTKNNISSKFKKEQNYYFKLARKSYKFFLNFN